MFSFATFFLLLIYEDSLTRRGGTFDICKHPLHREHHICFLKGNMLASFKVSRIQLRDLVMPSPQMKMPSKDPNQEELSHDLNDVNIDRQEMFTQINDKLSKIKAESTSQSLITSITVLINDCAKDFDSLKKLGDDIENNIKDNTQLHEMRISILMLKVHLLKTITTWKQKLTTLADLKRKEEKTTSSALSRHPSGNNITTLPPPIQLQQQEVTSNITSQTSLKSNKNDATLQIDVPSKSSYPEQDHETKPNLKVDLQCPSEKEAENLYISSASIMESHKLSDSQKSISSPSAQTSNQITVQPTKHKWHARDTNNCNANFQLISPFPTTLHADLYLKPGVLVDESQPSSIIAYTLASSKLLISDFILVMKFHWT